MTPMLVYATITLLCHGATPPDLSELTALAQGALLGEGVDEPVPGFEILLLRDGEEIYHEAFGDWTVGRVAACDSSTKTLSGALLMSVLETAPGVTLDTPLATFLPAFNVPLKTLITPRTAFSHTSGLTIADSQGVLVNPNLTLQQAAATIAQLPMTGGLPGATFNYGGISMHATGAFIEAVGQASFITLATERLTGPMQMDYTRYVLASDTNPRIAGGAESTAADFARLMDMLLNHGIDRPTGKRILLSASVDAMLTRQTSDAQAIANSPVNNNRYGIGVWLDQLDQHGPSVRALAGGARGFHAWISPAYGLTFVFCTDRTSFNNVEELSSRMHAVILRAVRCPADLTSTGTANEVPDGVVNGSDFTYFLSLFAANNPAADLTTTGTTNGTPDGIINGSDFTYYLSLFAAGCP